MFADLAPDDLVTLAQSMRYQRFSKGAFIIGRHDRSSCLHILVSGRVKVSLAHEGGKELALYFLEAPTHFGELSLANGDAHLADVIALSESEVLAIDSRELSVLIQMQPKVALTLIGVLSRRLRSAVQRLEGLAFHDAQNRVMRVLLNVATAAYESRGIPVVSDLTHYDIATLAGTSRETVSRIVSQLVREGMIVTKGRTIVVDLLLVRERLVSLGL